MPFMFQDMSLCPCHTSKGLALCHEQFSSVLTAPPLLSCCKNVQLPIERVHSSNRDQNLSSIRSKHSWSLLQTFNAQHTCCALSEKLKCSVNSFSHIKFTSNWIVFPFLSWEISLPVGVMIAFMMTWICQPWSHDHVVFIAMIQNIILWTTAVHS